MATAFTVIIVDRRTGGLGEQDLTHRFDAAASHLVGNAFDRVATSEYVFRLHPTDSFHIDSFGEVWAGYRDTTTGVWDYTRPLYGGFITEHEGSFDGPTHVFTCTVSNYNLLFDRTEVLTWPIDPTDPPAGYPVDHSVADWLIGSSPYPGVVPFHWQHVAYSAADVFDTIILDETAMPAQGMSTNYGLYGFMSTRALLDEIMKVARWKGLRDGVDIKPIYFFYPRLNIDGTVILPQFYAMDLNDTGGDRVVATYAQTPGVGERPIEHGYRHRRNATPARTRVTVKGVDVDPATGALNYYSYLKADGDAAYPTYYQKRPGWAMAPINESSLNTLAGCERYATDLGDALWGPEGTITVPTFYPTQAGDQVRITMPPDGMSATVFPVLQVEGSLIPHLYQLTLGHRPRTLEDILVPRPDAPMPQTDAGTGGDGNRNASGAGLGMTGANVANAPRTRSIQDTPVHSDQNVISGRTNDVTALRLRATSRTVPAAFRDPLPIAPLRTSEDPDGNVRDWDSGVDGTNHPHHYVGGVAAAGFLVLPIPDPCSLIRETIQNIDATPNTDVTSTYALNGVSVSNPTALTPIVCARDDVVVVTFAGTFPTDGIAYKLTEAGDLP